MWHNKIAATRLVLWMWSRVVALGEVLLLQGDVDGGQ
jgi:hypothetical protein